MATSDVRSDILCIALAVGLAACGDGPVHPAGPGPDTTAPAVASVTVTPDTIRFGARGSSVQLAAVARDAAGSVIAGKSAEWTVRSGTAVQVDSTGRVTALAAGSATVIATVDSAAGEARAVVAQVAAQLVIMPGSHAFPVVGDSVRLTAVLADSNGFPVPGPPAVTWQSSDTTVVLARAAGDVVAAGVGRATITASTPAITDSVTVTVEPMGPDGPAVVGGAVPCSGGMAGPFPCAGMDLVAYLPLGALGTGSPVVLNDLWGWTDSVSGADWAIVGRSDGTAFVNVSDPENPYYAGFLPRTAGSPATAWRDMKVYANHAYIVSDGAGSHGVQIFDLTRLRGLGPRHRLFSETAAYTDVASVHNIAINEATGFAYVLGANGGPSPCVSGLHMLDLATPASPAFAGCFRDSLTGSPPGYTHDAQCVVYAGPHAAYAGREICFGLNENALSIADVTDKGAPVALSRASYPGVAYVHQGWLTPDHRYLYSDDELDEFAGAGGAAPTTRTLIWDVADLEDPLMVGEVFGPTAATDHNLYIVGTRLYASNYQRGIRVLDIGNPASPAELASFDTAPGETDTPGFDGSWSNYPFFASGIVVVTSADEGLFILRLN